MTSPMKTWALALVLFGVQGCAGPGNRARPVQAPSPEPGIVAPGEETVQAPASPEPAASPAPAQDSTPVASLVARVAGAEVSASDLILAWMQRDSMAVRRTMDELILDRIVVAEAARLGVYPSQDQVDAAVRRVRTSLEEEVRRAGSTNVEEFLSQRMGLDPKRYLRAVDHSALTDLLAERCVRSYTLGEERCEVALILCADRESVDLVQAGLARGEAFGDLAKAHSQDPSSVDGGHVPAILRNDSALSRLAFHTEPGEVGGPLAQSGRWLFVQVIHRREPQKGPWSQMGPLVERTLGEDPISDPEYWQWKEAMLKLYEVDTSPLLELVGEPIRGEQ